MKWFWRLVILAVMVVAALLLKCVYLRPPGAEPRAAPPPDAGPSPSAPDSPAVAPPTTAPPNASPGASQSSGAAAGSASTPEPQSDLPIDPSQPMPERSLSTDGALERDKPARFLVEGRSDIYSAGLVAADPERGTTSASSVHPIGPAAAPTTMMIRRTIASASTRMRRRATRITPSSFRSRAMQASSN